MVPFIVDFNIENGCYTALSESSTEKWGYSVFRRDGEPMQVASLATKSRPCYLKTTKSSKEQSLCVQDGKH